MDNNTHAGADGDDAMKQIEIKKAKLLEDGRMEAYICEKRWT